MRAFVENGRFVISGLPYDRKEEAKSCGFHWSKSGHVWMCPANFISAFALVSGSRPGDDVEEIGEWLKRKTIPEKTDWDGLSFAPMDHQRKGATSLLGLKRFGLFFEMACGKTLTSLMVARELWKEGRIRRVLIVCTTSLFSTWRDEIAKHIGKEYPLIKIWGTSTKRRKSIEEWKGADPKVLTFAITSWDTLPRIWTEMVLPEPPGYLIGDESSFIKNRKATRTKAAIAVADKSEYVTALTGTPYVNDVSDLWSQMRFLSQTYAGESFWRFAERYIEFDNSPWRRPKGIRKDNEQELKNLLNTVSMSVRKKDVLDLPEKIYQERTVVPGSEQKRLLDLLMKEFYILVEAVKKGKNSKSQERILIKNALGRVNKMQQITMGWTKNEDGQIIRFKENPKADSMADIIEEARGQKIVVFSRFVEDLEIVHELGIKEKRTPVLYHGQMSEREAEESKTKFQKGNADIFCCQVQKGGFGIDLTAAEVCVYLTNWWSEGVRRQSEDRLHRPGQKVRPLYIDLIVDGSVDRHIVTALKESRSVSEYLFGKSAEEREE